MNSVPSNPKINLAESQSALSKFSVQTTEPKKMTLCFLIENGHVLLGYKKKGFGNGRWNGFGGKVEPGETIEQGAVREMQEEAGVKVTDLEARGKITFKFADKVQPLDVYVFVSKTYTGQPVESDEMRPAWFNIGQVPFKSMWIDDEFWLPQVLAGKSVEAYFLFDGESTIAEKRLKFY